MIVAVSNGELIDRISILKVKIARLDDSDKVALAKAELEELMEIVDELEYEEPLIRLEDVNSRLWDAIAKAKSLFAMGDIGKDFTSASINTIVLNDRRYLIKKNFDEKTGSKVREVKAGL